MRVKDFKMEMNDKDCASKNESTMYHQKRTQFCYLHMMY